MMNACNQQEVIKDQVLIQFHFLKLPTILLNKFPVIDNMLLQFHRFFYSYIQVILLLSSSFCFQSQSFILKNNFSILILLYFSQSLLAISIIFPTLTSLSFWIEGNMLTKSCLMMIYFRYLRILIQQQYRQKYRLYPSQESMTSQSFIVQQRPNYWARRRASHRKLQYWGNIFQLSSLLQSQQSTTLRYLFNMRILPMIPCSLSSMSLMCISIRKVMREENIKKTQDSAYGVYF